MSTLGKRWGPHVISVPYAGKGYLGTYAADGQGIETKACTILIHRQRHKICGARRPVDPDSRPSGICLSGPGKKSSEKCNGFHAHPP
jgi:hypothetical protein